MLQEPGQLVVCNNHSGVCRWQCLSWCSPRLASLRLVFQCFHKPKRVSIHLFYFFPREASDPEDTCLAVGPAPEWCRSPLGSPTRFARRRSAISLATRSNHSTEPHSPRGLHFAIYRQSSLDENFQRALVRPLQAKKKKTYGSCWRTWLGTTSQSPALCTVLNPCGETRSLRCIARIFCLHSC